MYTELNLIQTATGFFLVATDNHGQLSHDFFVSKEAALDFAASFLPYQTAKFTQAKVAALACDTQNEGVKV